MFDGWIQVRNSHGAQGIVPLTYVEYVNSASHDVRIEILKIYNLNYLFK